MELATHDLSWGWATPPTLGQHPVWSYEGEPCLLHTSRTHLIVCTNLFFLFDTYIVASEISLDFLIMALSSDDHEELGCRFQNNETSWIWDSDLVIEVRAGVKKAKTCITLGWETPS